MLEYIENRGSDNQRITDNFASTHSIKQIINWGCINNVKIVSSMRVSHENSRGLNPSKEEKY